VERCRAAALAGLVALGLWSEPAAATDDLGGPWVSSRSGTEVFDGEWGAACGPLPAFALVALPLRLDVEDDGAALLLRGEGLAATTAHCPAPLVHGEARHDGSAWTLECDEGTGAATAGAGARDGAATAGGATAVHHTITFAAVDPTRLEVRERAVATRTGAEGAACRAVAVLTASYARESPASLLRRAADDPRCTKASVASSVTLRPAAAALRSGAATCFAAEAYDADGCPAALTPTFALSVPDGVDAARDVGTLASDGCFRAAAEVAATTPVVVLARSEHATGVALLDLLPLHPGAPLGPRGTRTAAAGAGEGAGGGAALTGTEATGAGTGSSGVAGGAPTGTLDEGGAAGAADRAGEDATRGAGAGAGAGGGGGGGRADISTIIGAALAVGVTGALAVLLGHFITLWSRRRQTPAARAAKGRATPPRAAVAAPAGKAVVPMRSASVAAAGPPSAGAASPGPSQTPTLVPTGARPVAQRPSVGSGGSGGGAGAAPPSAGGVPSAATLVLLQRPESPEVLVCPACRREYEDGARFCVADGSTLVSQSVAQSTLQGGICPRCNRGVDAGTRHCPHDGEEVLPYAVYQTTRGTDPPHEGHRICPSCAAKYEGAATFCGRDGAELVLLN
jgi:hypothetical protein